MKEGAKYTYAGKAYDTKPWTAVVGKLKEEINDKFEEKVNLVVNHYRDGEDTLGFQTDDEADMVPG